MDFGLKGKRALVTGSSSGIGEGIAHQLAEAGATVVVHGRNPQRTSAVARAINERGGRAISVTGDLTEDGVAAHIREQVDAELGGIDVLVNNAGGRYAGFDHMDWFGIPAQDWLGSYKLNVVAAALMIEQFVPGMKARGWGRAIQISSGIAIQQPPVFPDYQAAKTAVVSLSGSLAKALSGSGVTSNTISAGVIYTPGSDGELDKAARAFGMDDWQKDERRFALEFFHHAVPRVGRPGDIAGAVLYMASQQADFITGAHLVVDGGGASAL
ncbi:SDR family oxidoreductase [Paraburkholderia sp. J67]|uniref:SDR family NAD(P)-dependent oxidoreductase n=1 Tax=Paraburkholderia sp. J67 TaxID=2805435 RepID=UPI002ABD3822|nr:SDR family oxidoreductase [Paraburkholderia sp. J67]